MLGSIPPKSQLTAVVEQLPTGVILADQIIRYLNPAAATLLGVDPDALIGRPTQTLSWQLINAQGQPLAPADNPLLRAIETQQGLRDVVVGLFVRSRWVWLLINADPFEAGALTLFTLSDITAQRQASSQQRSQANLMRSLLNTLNVGVLVLDPAEEVVLVNSAWCGLFNADPSENGLSLWAAVSELDGPSWYARCQAVMQQQQEWQSEPLELANGCRVLANYQPLVEGQHLWEFRDVTAQQLALRQRQLESEQERLVAEVALRIRQGLEIPKILEATTQEIQRCLQSDRVLMYRYVEAETPIYEALAEQVHGPYPIAKGVSLPAARLDPDDCAMRSPLTVVEDVSQVEVPPFIRSYLRQLEVKAYLMASIWVDDTLWGVLIVQHCRSTREWQVWEQTFISRMAVHIGLAIQQGQVYAQAQQLNTVLDRQVRVRTAQLDQQLQELQRLSHLKDDFFCGASHELRSPLTTMRMALRLLQQFTLDLPPETQTGLNRYLDILDAECNRELELVNDLLDLQALGKTTLEVEPLDLERLLGMIVTTFRDRAAPAHLHYEQSDSLPMLYTDPSVVGRILRELVHNACKYTAPDTTITIHTTTHSDAIAVSISNPAEIPPEAIAQLFDRFYRVPGGDRNEQGGTGLGLALAKGLAEQMGGSLTARQYNGLLTLILTLPL